MTVRDNYRAHAEAARREADTSTLDNVRDKLLRSASAWDQMAQREDRVAAARQARADEKEIAGDAPGVALGDREA